MSKKVCILDYDVGNLHSVLKAFQFLGIEAKISDHISDIEDSDLLVMPGQGAFSSAMASLTKKSLIEPVMRHIHEQRPFLGICVGFQVLFEGSEEKGDCKGLGIFPGRFTHIPDQELKVPHMGWNALDVVSDPNHVFDSTETPYTYFVHSYYLKETSTDIVSTRTQYGESFVSTVQSKNLLATQYHPEKSGDVGMAILKQFVQGVLS